MSSSAVACCFLLATSAFSVCCSAQLMSQTVCKRQTLPEGRTFDNCTDLPTLGATLHWTYDPATGNLSVAFTASNPNDGWVAWGINPTKLGMEGTQALVAFRKSMSLTANTYNVSSYHPTPGDILYDVSNLEAVLVGDVTMIFAKMMLRAGTMKINSVWQIGEVKNNEIASHGDAPANLGSVMVLDLIHVGSSNPEAPSDMGAPPPPPPSGSPVGNKNGNSAVVLTSFIFLLLCWFTM